MEVHLEGYLPGSHKMNFYVEGIFRVDHVPERGGSEKSVSPVTTDLSTKVCQVICGAECGGADVGKNFRWEFVDGCEHVSHRPDRAGSSDQAFFDHDDLRRRVSEVFDREKTTEGSGGILLRGKGSNPRYHA